MDATVIGHLAEFLHSLPLLCLFLSILLGTFIGRFHVKGVGFGTVVGTLIAGMAIGIVAKPELPDVLRWRSSTSFCSRSGIRWVPSSSAA